MGRGPPPTAPSKSSGLRRALTGIVTVIVPGGAPGALEDANFRSIRAEVAGFSLLHASEPIGRDGRGDREWTGLDADGGQCAARLVSKGAQGTGDIGEAAQASKGDGEVT